MVVLGDERGVGHVADAAICEIGSHVDVQVVCSTKQDSEGALMYCLV